MMPGHSIQQNRVQQRLVNLDAALVFDEAEFAKAVHQEVDAGASAADHLG
jgi:hypothetical protein